MVFFCHSAQGRMSSSVASFYIINELEISVKVILEIVFVCHSGKGRMSLSVASFYIINGLYVEL